MTQNNHYEHKLVNIGEEVDNLINNLKERNRVLQIIVDSKKDVPEDFEHEKKVYQFRIDNLEKHNKKLQDDLAKGFELSLKDQDTVEELQKKLTEGFNLQEVDTILDSLDFRLRLGQDKGKDQTRELYKYFESMKIHLEECQSNMGETNNVT
jgi:hypothetical protein